MATTPSNLSSIARQAIAVRDWDRVAACAMEMARQSPHDAEGHFLMGVVNKAAGRPSAAIQSFETALAHDSNRYDAAIELVDQLVATNHYPEARQLLQKHRDALRESPMYLVMAGQAYFTMAHYSEAMQLYDQADQLQPNDESIHAKMAPCAVYLGDIDTAKKLYRKILIRHPKHQKTHYELAQLDTAKNDRHAKAMLKILRKGSADPARNIYLYYALGKEYEDLGRWNEAFEYYEKGGAAIKSVSNYDVMDDVDLIDRIIEVCTPNWLDDRKVTEISAKTPIFVVGLPRTGTTLTDRILSSHSQVCSAGESQLLQMVLRDGSRAGNKIGITVEQIEAASRRDAGSIASTYEEAITHRLGDEPYFIEKMPENVLYLGFIAKAWPTARIVHLRRHPLDACFAMFKQSYFRYAYTLDDLGEYYLAYDRLSRHWRALLGDRMIEVHYEDLVRNQKTQTERLLERLGLDFEDACLQFESNAAPVATASSVQVREAVHTRSVAKWKKFSRQLQPLRDRLEQAGLAI